MVAQVTDERAPFELVPIRWPPAVPTFAFHPGPQNTKPVLLRSTEAGEGEFALEVLSRKFEELVQDLGHLDSTHSCQLAREGTNASLVLEGTSHHAFPWDLVDRRYD